MFWNKLVAIKFIENILKQITNYNCDKIFYNK